MKRIKNSDMALTLNGQPQPIQPMVQNAMFYPNTYINFTQAGEYTKHYYNGTERIASRLGEQTIPISVEDNIELVNYQHDVKQILYNSLGQHLYDEPTDMQEGDLIPLEFLQATGDNNAVYYYHPNHLASSMYVTDAQQSVVQSFLYAPYGEIISEYNPGFNGNVLPNYAFNAKELDEETGMYYYEARYYKPPVFTSRDAIFEKYFWMSPYAYCANNPIKYVDPTGCEIGDFYDRKGNYLGNDGEQDGKIYLLKKGYRAKTENTNVNWGGTLSEKHVNELKSKSEEISMESDLGYMIRAVYAEMRGGDDNAKAIVAESIYNRSRLSCGYEKADGTYIGIVNKFYDVAKTNNAANNVFENPIEYIYKNSIETSAWRSSVKVSLKAHFGISDIGKGVIFYNSSSSTYYDNNNKMEKITLDVNHKGIKGLWKLK
ncbi:MAG: RHS repeat-associated core domain-containing protein [Bacteroidales bacterium]|nr:RHS repeat-associated core domain-containing protein [Bacteroidales bacterium]